MIGVASKLALVATHSRLAQVRTFMALLLVGVPPFLRFQFFLERLLERSLFAKNTGETKLLPKMCAYFFRLQLVKNIPQSLLHEEKSACAGNLELNE